MDKKTIKAAFTQARNQTTRGGRGASNNVNGWVFSAAWIADRFGWHAYYQLNTPEGKLHALGTGLDSCVNFAYDIIRKHEQAEVDMTAPCPVCLSDDCDGIC